MFPLPLSDFEYYMLVDDRPSHPMVFVMAAHLLGKLNREEFERALLELVECHPLLNCRVSEMSGMGWCWHQINSSSHHGASYDDAASVSSESGSNFLEWIETDENSVADFVPVIRRIDITSQSGLQLIVVASAVRARLFLYIHHACCDGIGGIQLLGELLARYGQKTAAADAKRPVFEAPRRELLLQRENYDTGEATAERHKRSLRKSVGKISRLLLRKPVLLAASASNASSLPQLPTTTEETPAAILEAMLSKSTNRQLRAVAAHHDVTINDLLIGQFLIHIRRWNSRTTRHREKDWIRLSVPVSMRTKIHEEMPVANVVSYEFVTRRMVECDDFDALLKSIHRKTTDVVHNREGIVCLKLFRVLRKIPGGMKWFLGLKSCLSTAVLANIGDVRRRFSGRFPLDNGKWIAGNVLVERITGVAPVRPNTRAAVSIGEYAGELSISLRTDVTSINPTDTQRFLNEFIKDLEHLASTAESTTTV